MQEDIKNNNYIEPRKYMNSSLEEITLPNNIKGIGYQAFASNHHLKKIILPESLETLEDEAFMGCEYLEEIVIPESVKELGKGLFKNCKRLKKVSLPKHLTAIPDEVFKNCHSLDITLDDNITSLGKETFLGCHSLSHFPSHVKSFGDACFKYCHGLKEVILDDEVSLLPTSLFDDCINLEEVIYNGGNGMVVHPRCFRNCQKLKDIPSFVSILSEGIFEGCDSFEEVTLHTLDIPVSAFRNCRHLKKVHNIDKVCSIGSNAFSGCLSLEEVDLRCLKRISAGAFRDCHHLKTCQLDLGLRDIGKEAFLNCYELENISLPDTVERIDKRAFKHCHSIRHITIPGALPRIWDDSFSYMSSLEKIDVSPFNNRFMTPDHIGLISEDHQKFVLYAMGHKDTSYSLGHYCMTIFDDREIIRPLCYIGPYAFAGAKNLNTLTICSCVNDIEKTSFDGCDNLHTLNIEGISLYSSVGLSMRDHGHYYFDDHDEVHIPVKEVNFRGNLIAIMGNALPCFKEVAKITLPDTGSYQLYDNAFESCINLKEITVPKNATYIGINALPKGSTPFFKDINLRMPNLISMTHNTDYNGDYKLYTLDDGTYYIEGDKIIKITKDDIRKAVSKPEYIEGNPILFLDFYQDLKEHHLLNEVFLNGILMANMSLENRLILFNNIHSNDEWEFKALDKSMLFQDNDNTTKSLLSSDNFMKVIDYLHLLRNENIQDKELFHKNFMWYMSLEDYGVLLKLDRHLLISVINRSNILNIKNEGLKKDVFEGRHLENFINLINEYDIKTKILLHPAFIALSDHPLVKELFSHYNANMKRVLILSKVLDNEETAKQNLLDLLTLLKITGCFSDDEKLSQRSMTFICEKMFSDNLPNNKNENQVIGDDLHRIFNFQYEDEINKEFINFYLENYPELLKQERIKAGFIERVYINFKEISKTATSHKGSQRKLKVTMDKCISYLSSVKFDGVSSEHRKLAELIGAWYDKNETWLKAKRVYEEAKMAPRNIFDKIEVSDEGKIIYLHDKRTDLKEKVNDNFSYEWLPKQNMDNLVLGKYCNCCAHVEGAGEGIMRASMIHDSVQNLVVRNEKGEIIAKSTLYVNRSAGYAVFNNVESSFNYRSHKDLIKIYKAFMRGTKAFIERYNENNDIKLSEVTIGANRNTILDCLRENNHPEVNIHDSLEFGDYSVDSQYHYAGDWKTAQRLVFKI